MEILSQLFQILSKPPVLDTKWKNRNINVSERANIPKFNKLGDIEGLLSDFSNYSLMMY